MSTQPGTLSGRQTRLPHGGSRAGPRSSGRPGGPGRAGGALRRHGPRGCPLAGVPGTQGPLETPDGSCAGLVCLLCFLTSSCFTLRSGSYWLEIFDQYATALNLILLAFFEVVGVVYVYGMKQ